MVGAQSSPYLPAGDIQASLTYRYQYSHRHYVGDVEQTIRAQEGSEVRNYANMFDLSVVYAVSERFNISASLPYVINERSIPLRAADQHVIDRYLQHATGVGDLSFLGRYWLLDTQACSNYNISVGLGAKLPTGQDNVVDARRAYDPKTGKVVIDTAVVDQSIQPGDGGVGAIADIAGFARFDIFGVYLSASYVSNLRGPNGVQTFRKLSTEQVMAGSDLFVARAGGLLSLPFVEGLTVLLGGRIEGVPKKNLISSSEGFRRPGYAISLEPGLSYSYDKTAVIVQVPIALYRNRLISVSDEEGGNSEGGDAAFADWFIVASLIQRF